MKPSRIYLAGASSEAALCASFMQRLRAAGHTITHDWTRQVLADKADGRDEAALTSAEAQAYAFYDTRGVEDAEALWLLAPAVGKTEGGWCEFGMATALRRVTVVSGVTSNIFRTRARFTYPTHEAALAWLCEPAEQEAEAAQ